MGNLLFAAKRQLRAGFLLCLVLAVVLPRLALCVGAETGLRPCGLYCADNSDSGAELAALLEADGFLRYDSREALTTDVADGTLNCGAVLESGLSERLATDTLDGAVTLYTSASSYLPQVPEAQLQARLFTASAAARTEKAIQRTGAAVADTDIEARLEALYARGKLFTFAVETVSGTPMADAGAAVGRRLLEAACALMLFTALLPAIRREVIHTRRIARRTGLRAAVCELLLPSLFWLLLLGLLAGLAAGVSAPGLAAYLLCLLFWGMVYALVPERAAGTLLTLWVTGSLVLTPVWVDLSEFVPAVSWLRLLFPASLFSEFADAPFPLLLLLLALMLAAVCPTILRRSRNARI